MNEIDLQQHPMAANQPLAARQQRWTPEMTATIKGIIEANGGYWNCGPETVFELMPANSGFTLAEVRRKIILLIRIRGMGLQAAQQAAQEAAAQQAAQEAAAQGQP